MAARPDDQFIIAAQNTLGYIGDTKKRENSILALATALQHANLKAAKAVAKNDQVAAKNDVRVTRIIEQETNGLAAMVKLHNQNVKAGKATVDKGAGGADFQAKFDHYQDVAAARVAKAGGTWNYIPRLAFDPVYQSAVLSQSGLGNSNAPDADNAQKVVDAIANLTSGGTSSGTSSGAPPVGGATGGATGGTTGGTTGAGGSGSVSGGDVNINIPANASGGIPQASGGGGGSVGGGSQPTGGGDTGGGGSSGGSPDSSNPLSFLYNADGTINYLAVAVIAGGLYWIVKGVSRG